MQYLFTLFLTIFYRYNKKPVRTIKTYRQKGQTHSLYKEKLNEKNFLIVFYESSTGKPTILIVG